MPRQFTVGDDTLSLIDQYHDLKARRPGHQATHDVAADALAAIKRDLDAPIDHYDNAAADPTAKCTCFDDDGRHTSRTSTKCRAHPGIVITGWRRIC